MTSPETDPQPSAGVARTIADECVASRVRRLGRVVNGIYEAALRPEGLTISQMNLLVAISCMREPSPGQVCAALDLEKSTLSRNLDRMVEHGWVETRPGEDGRSFRLAVTAKGARILRDAYPAWRKAQRRAMRLLGEPGLAAIQRATRRVRI